MKKPKYSGKLTLQENIEIIEKNKIANTFVAHVPMPLSSYYSRFTDVSKPNSVIFFTDGANSSEQIIRSTRKINEKNDLQLDGAKSRVIIGNKTHRGFRVRGIKRFSNIEEIQRMYQKEGLSFAKNEPYKGDVDSLVRVTKFFDFEKLDDGIYKSKLMTDTYYIEIPKPTSWDEFREMTFDIKNNISVSNYDIVKGIIYCNDEVIDILRVMKPGISYKALKLIQEKYWQRMTNLSFLNNLV